MPTALPMWALAYVVGIWLGDALGLGWYQGRWAVLVAGAVLLGSLCARRLLGCALLLAALALGGLAQAHREPVPELPELLGPESAQDRPKEALLCEGHVLAAPLATAEGTSVRVAVERLGAGDGTAWYEVAPPIWVLVSVRGGLLEPLWPGDPVRLRTRLRSPQGFANPGAQDNLRRAAAEGIQALGSVEPAAIFRWDRRWDRPWDRAPAVGVPPGPRDAAKLRLLLLVARLRVRLIEALRQRLLPPGTQDPSRYALTASLVLGERGALAQADAYRQATGAGRLDRAFRDAGIYHVLSISGLHLAVASYLFYVGLAALLVRVPPLSRRLAVRRLAAAGAIPATVLYTLLTGAEVATVRAATVAVLWFLAVACGRRARLGEALAGAVLFLLHPGAAPLALFDPALQLSLAAALGTAYLRPLHRLLPLLSDDGAGERDLPGRLARAVLRLLDATVAAGLATAPLCALHFAQFQAAGVVGNLVAVPLGELIVVPVGLGGALLSLLWPSGGGLLLDVAGAAALGMAEMADQVAGWGLSYAVPAPSVWVTALWALGLLGLGLRLRSWPLPCALALLLYFAGWARPPHQLVATFLDVGQGDAAVLELPGGGVVVVDGGGLGEQAYDPGDRVVAPYLRRRGHRRIDLLVASHPHPDHVGGLAALIEQFPVTELWTAEPPGPRPGPRGREPVDPSWQRVLAGARGRGVPVVLPHPLDLGGAHIEPLFPCLPAPGPAPCQIARHRELGHNDNSLVLRVRYAGRALLLPGDLELPGELLLLERHDQGVDLRADVLKAPHHCSKTSSSDSLLREVAPKVAICSLGLGNRYGFPHPEAAARYEQAGIPLWRTDLYGAIQAVITPDGGLTLRATRTGATLRLNPRR